MNVELVSVQTADDVRLDGYLRAAVAVQPAVLGVDLVICHHGVGGNFYNPSFFDRMGDALVQHGCALLRVNNRGHDQAYHTPRRRLGAAYEVLNECRLDIKAWLDFAETRGYRRLALWGHSLGAVKTIYCLSVDDADHRVLCAIASSPPRFSYAAYLSTQDGPRFRTDIERAQQLVEAGSPHGLIEALVPQTRPFSAQTYLDKYGPADRYDYFSHLPRARVPLLLTLGSLERDNVSFAPLAEHGPAMHAQWPNVTYSLIEGADHAYTNRTAELWAAARTWLERLATGGLSSSTHTRVSSMVL